MALSFFVNVIIFEFARYFNQYFGFERT